MSTSTQRIEDSQRCDAVRNRRGELEPDWPADVVHDEVEALEAKRIDRGDAETPQPSPRVVVAGRAVRQPETRQVERDPSQPARPQLGNHFAI